MQKKFLRPALFRIAGFVLLFAFLAWLPLTALDGPTTCLFRAATGKLCPGCGATHAFALVMKGQFAQAMAENAVFTCILFPLLALTALQDAIWLLCFPRRSSLLERTIQRTGRWLKG